MAVDYKLLASTVDDLREMTRAAVAALVTDGFTDKQARAIITRVLSAMPSEDEAKDPRLTCDYCRDHHPEIK